jgi:hypothetical protein
MLEVEHYQFGKRGADVCRRKGWSVRIATVVAAVIPFAGLGMSPGRDRVTKNPNRLCGV